MPELNEVPLGYMRSPNGALIELFSRGAQYFTRVYEPLAGRDAEGQPKSDADVDLTEQQADEYRRIMTSCGGVTTSQRIRPHLVAEKEHTT